MRIECPHCETSYPITRTCVRVEPGVTFTIVCAVCGKDFDGKFWLELGTEGTPSVPASRAYRWTGGLFGTSEVPEVPAVPPFVSVETVKRS